MSSPTNRREGSTPHFQVPRRASHSRPIEVPRISVSPSGESTMASPRPVLHGMLSTSAPDALDTIPMLHTSLRNPRTKGYGATQGSSGPSRESSSSGRIQPQSGKSSILPTSSPAPSSSKTRSFLVAPNTKASALSTLPKRLRTTKTSQKLVVLPSAPQTKPLSKQLVLLDEGQESSDDATLPHGPLPPRRSALNRKPFSKLSAASRLKPRTDEEKERKEATEEGEPSKTRLRDYKSSAERMTKEQRKAAGYKRMTAYCVAEGLKMKVLAGFLKREHNVLPRVFDEALYVVSSSRRSWIWSHERSRCITSPSCLDTVRKPTFALPLRQQKKYQHQNLVPTSRNRSSQDLRKRKKMATKVPTFPNRTTSLTSRIPIDPRRTASPQMRVATPLPPFREWCRSMRSTKCEETKDM